jgi:hypothetical protein
MPIWIRFIGLILLYRANANSPYQAIIPYYDKDKDATYCGNQIMEHIGYIRVATGRGNLVDDTGWPKDKDCDAGLNCAVYGIPVGSTLTINAGFTPDPKHQGTLSCLMPDARAEKLYTNPVLRPEAFTTLSRAVFELPPGDLYVEQFRNDQIFTELRVFPQAGVQPGNIEIVATPRLGIVGHSLRLIVTPTTIVDVLNVPESYAGMDYDTVRQSANPYGHFYFFQKLFDLPRQECKAPAGLAPESCSKPRLVRDHSGGQGATHDIGCGNLKLE